MGTTSFSLRQKILLESFKRFRKVETALHPLNYLFWECTLRCNLSCLHCGSDCFKESSIPDMPAKDFLDVAREISKSDIGDNITVVITGGEPLLRKDLEEVGYELRKMGFRWGFVTNGMQLTKTRLNSLLNAGLGSITLSIDGFEEDHNWLRQNSRAFENAQNALSLISEQKRLISDVVTCVNKKNIKSLDKLYKSLAESNLKAWRLFTITPIGRAAEIPEFKLSSLEMNYLMQFIEKCRKNKKNGLDVNFSCEAYLGSYESKVRDGLFFCRAGINIGSVLIDGSISACPNIDRNMIQGSIYEDSFVDVWKDKFMDFRDRSWTKTGICAECKDYKYCGGNGLHWWKRNDPSLLLCHKHCLDQDHS
ncbi:MAG: radical SAM protein [Bacteroidetes bacterium]|nr:radical SAM protein [Bacteroidota bacterium]MBT3750034.1 radical SAM protein [Bacteroidota bacterium]MBT4399808.1 radical SAM protein [Bacteroidota bacterium]MBT4410289.1 radical SAM protein [Bacteroidota bacterium]MBT5425980.1 radical SAM protein [Bacteroidota bacterium]